MFCWPRLLFLLTVLLLGISSMLSACGQTGPLYLPDSSEQQKQQ